MKIDWKTKLCSRKFWAAVIGFVTALLTAFNMSELTIQQAAAIISAVGALMTYILAEGYVDGKRAEWGSCDGTEGKKWDGQIDDS